MYQSAAASQAGLNPGFQDPFANLNFLATIPDKMDVYFDMYIASRPHPSTMYGHEGYLLFKQLPVPFGGDNGLLGGLFDEINVKVGAFDIDFGDQNYRRSNNARVQRNPLVGNYLIDPNVEEIGGEVYSIKGPIHWLVGLGSGTTTEHFDYGAAPSFHAKLWGNPLPEVRTSLSMYDGHLGNSADTSYLFVNGRSGGTYAAVFGGGDNPGQILPQGGKDVTAVQGDLDLEPLALGNLLIRRLDAGLRHQWARGWRPGGAVALWGGGVGLSHHAGPIFGRAIQLRQRRVGQRRTHRRLG